MAERVEDNDASKLCPWKIHTSGNSWPRSRESALPHVHIPEGWDRYIYIYWSSFTCLPGVWSWIIGFVVCPTYFLRGGLNCLFVFDHKRLIMKVKSFDVWGWPTEPIFFFALNTDNYINLNWEFSKCYLTLLLFFNCLYTGVSSSSKVNIN